MRILVTGGKGRLGSRLAVALKERGFVVDAPGRSEVDWASAVEVSKALSANHYGMIIGCAAYTDVAKAQQEVGKCHADTYATAFNTSRLAELMGIPFLYVSTDYVVPLLNGESGGAYAVAKLRAERASLRHGAKIVRLAFTTVEQTEEWKWVNAYSVAHRWWVEEAVEALADAALDPSFIGGEVRQLGPEAATTPAALLAERFPDHGALKRLVTSPEEKASLVGYAAPIDSRFQ